MSDSRGYARLVPHGVVKEWWENGKLRSEGTYKAGKLDGAMTSWFESGAEYTRETWKDGHRASLIEHDQHGKVVKDEKYNEDGSRK